MSSALSLLQFPYDIPSFRALKPGAELTIAGVTVGSPRKHSVKLRASAGGMVEARYKDRAGQPYLVVFDTQRNLYRVTSAPTLREVPPEADDTLAEELLSLICDLLDLMPGIGGYPVSSLR